MSRALGWATRADLTLALLAFASSTTDVLSFLALGGVFTSAMTGNTALLGLAIGQGRLLAASRSLAALIGFVGGVAGATLLGGRRSPRALTAALALEAACLTLFALLWRTFGHGEGAVYALIVLAALAMGAQSVAARQIDLPAIPTVVFTSTLTSIVVGATGAALRRHRLPADTIRQTAIFCVYLAGAVLAGVLAQMDIGSVVLPALAAVLCALALRPTAAKKAAPVGPPSG